MSTPTNSARCRVSRPSLPTKIKRRIRFGTTSAFSRIRSIILSLSATGTIYASLVIMDNVQTCQQSLADQMQMSNTTSSKASLQYGIANEKCRCRLSSNGTEVPEHCIEHLQLRMMQMLPLLSVILQSFAIRELFTLSEDCNRVFVRVAWASTPFVLLAIAISMFSDHCYHFVISLSIFVTAYLLILLVVRDCERTRTAANSEDQGESTVRSAPPAESTDKYVQSWNEIVWSDENSIARGPDFRSLHLFAYYLCSVFVSLLIN